MHGLRGTAVPRHYWFFDNQQQEKGRPMSHNKQLDALLSRVRKAADDAREEKDFGPVFSMLRDFQRSVGPIRYDNRAKWYVCAVVGALGGIFALAYFLSPDLQQGLGDAGYVVMGAFGIGVF